MRARVAISFAVALTFVVGVLSGPARAVPLMTIHGTVSDPLGRGIQGAEVDDGRSHATFTDASGHYQIEESSLGTYVVTVAKTGVNSASKTVGPAEALSPVDFSLTYIVVGTLSTTAVSTAAGPASATLTLTNSAPNPGDPGEAGGASCVYVTDTRTGLTASATYSSTDPSTGASTWTYTLSFEQGTTEGAYQVSFLAKDCSTGTVLSTTGSRTYVVDNTAPAIEGVLPADGGNTVFPNGQPLLAVINDGDGSGVLSSGVDFTLTDETESPPQATSYAGSSVSYNPATRWAKTSPVVLTVGHVYRIGVRVQDRAGNMVSYAQRPTGEGGGFLATTVALGLAPKASIPRSPCAVSEEIDPATGMKTATCEDVPLHIDGSTLTMGGSRGDAVGVVLEKASLESARVGTTIAGVDMPTLAAPRSGDPAWEPKTEAAIFEVTGTETAFAVDLAPINVGVGTLTSRVPAAWSDAWLQMDPARTVSSTATCRDPSVSPGCLPDLTFAAPWRVWDPPIPVVHVARCDSALNHKEVVAPTPSRDLTLTLAVDTARLTPEAANLLYRVNEEAAETLSVAGSAGSYSFTIPAERLPEGTRLSYAFEVRGHFLEPNCAAASAAVSPTRRSFHVLATADASRSNPALQRAVGDALLGLWDQPGYSPDSDPSVMCTSFFAPPTPCELFPARGSSPVTPESRGPDATPHLVAGKGVGPRTCQILFMNYYVMWPGEEWDSFGSSATNTRYPSFNGVLQESAASHQDFWDASAEARMKTQVGFQAIFWYSGTPTVLVPAQAVIGYLARGRTSASTQSDIAFPGVLCAFVRWCGDGLSAEANATANITSFWGATSGGHAEQLVWTATGAHSQSNWTGLDPPKSTTEGEADEAIFTLKLSNGALHTFANEFFTRADASGTKLMNSKATSSFFADGEFQTTFIFLSLGSGFYWSEESECDALS